MKRVAVVHEDGRVLRTYDIDLGDLDREPQVHWYFKQARENAIADKLVTESEANRIHCRFVDDLGELKASIRPAAQASFLARKGADSAATKRHDETDQSRSEVPNSESTHLGRLAKNLAWAALIAALIAAVWAVISVSFSSS